MRFEAAAAMLARWRLVYAVDSDGRITALTVDEYAGLPVEVANALSVSLEIEDAIVLSQQRRSRS